MFSIAIKERGAAARDQLASNLGQVRSGVVSRLGDVDTAALKKQGQTLKAQGLDYAAEVRRQAEKRGVPLPFLPEPRRKSRRWPLAAILAGVALGVAGATAYFLYDRQRRESVKQRLNQVQSAAYDRYTNLGGVQGAIQGVRGRVNGSDLKDKVVAAISGGGEFPQGLEVEVEGRTVYLKGEIADAAAADAAAERAHTVEGVVAVVNHTTSPAPSQNS
ncbi:MAG: BON domain-containing protein [Candidatus Dormibacteraeota bacterium]|nr:BON domain-containing protein [Candidatus Dormibacteraeota bacterium]